MTDISVSTTSYQSENRSWLLSPAGTGPGETPSITLDISGFVAGTNYPNGYIPSGTPLAVIASGLYVPYIGATTGAGTLTRTSTGGTIQLTINGETTNTIPASAAGFTAAATQAAIRAMGGDFADYTVSGGAGGPLTVTGHAEEVLDVAVDNALATGGTIVWAQTVAGGVETPAGEALCKGLLFSSVKVPNTAVTTIDAGGALLVSGFVKLSKLPIALDANGQRDLPLIHFVA